MKLMELHFFGETDGTSHSVKVWTVCNPFHKMLFLLLHFSLIYPNVLLALAMHLIYVVFTKDIDMDIHIAHI